jgi:hypothetical protein
VEKGVSSEDFESVESITLSERVDMLGVLGASLLATVWDEDIAEVICWGTVDVRVGDDFRNLQTNRTFLNT